MAALCGERSNRLLPLRLLQPGNGQRGRHAPHTTSHSPGASEDSGPDQSVPLQGLRRWNVLGTAHCNQHRAPVDRMVDVQANLTLSQQVKVAEGGRRAAAALHSAPQVAMSPPVLGNRRQYVALKQQIQHWDAMARQLQSVQMQDWFRVARHTTMTASGHSGLAAGKKFHIAI